MPIILHLVKNNRHCTIQKLSSFAVGQKYLPKEWNEKAAVPTWQAVGEEIQTFTPAEMRRLMLAADKRMLPFRAMGGFAGLGTTEIQQENRRAKNQAICAVHEGRRSRFALGNWSTAPRA
jgi:hypothetical protein